MESLSYAPEDGKYYSKSLDEFRKKTNETTKVEELLSLHLPNAVRKILQGHHRIPHQFNVLSIGCGDGEFDRYIVSIIKEELKRDEKYKNTKILNCAIDPNTYFANQYKAKIEKSSNDDQTVYSVYNKTFEEYKQERTLKKGSDSEGEIKFDIVHLIHSIYYFDQEEALIHIFEKELQEKGQVVCVIDGKVSLIRLFVSHCSQLLQDEKPVLEEAYPEKIKEIVEKRGWKVDLHMQEYSIDVTEMFDENSSDGNLLLDFLTHIKNFRATAEKKKVEEVLQVIRELSQVMRNGKRLGKKCDGIMFICK